MKRDRLTAGDRRRIGQVFEQHRGYVEAVAVQHAGRDDAPDIVAEVGLRLCTSLNGLRDPRAIRTWIYRLTLNVAREVVRDRLAHERTRETVKASTDPTERVLNPDEYLRDARRRDAFMEALDRLKSRDRKLICNSLGPDRHYVSDGAERVALHRARQRLREFLLDDPRLRE